MEARVRTEDIGPAMQRASERPDHSEALTVIAAVSDGRVRSYYCPFRRTEAGQPILGEVISEDGDLESVPGLRDLREVWRRWRACEAKPHATLPA